MYALYYTIAQYYLTQKGYKEINSGSRPLSHETNIGEFRLHLGWRKAYGRLGLYLVPSLQIALAVVPIYRKVDRLILSRRHYAMFESLLLAQDLARTTEMH